MCSTTLKPLHSWRSEYSQQSHVANKSQWNAIYYGIDVSLGTAPAVPSFGGVIWQPTTKKLRRLPSQSLDPSRIDCPQISVPRAAAVFREKRWRYITHHNATSSVPNALLAKWSASALADVLFLERESSQQPKRSLRIMFISILTSRDRSLSYRQIHQDVLSFGW